MTQDTTLTEDDIKKLAQRGGMDLGDQQNFWEFHQNTATLLNGLGEAAPAMPDRSSMLGVPFQLSTTKYTFVTYTCGLLLFDAADDAGMFLLSDSAADPTTVRAKVSYFNAAEGAGPGYTSMRGTLTYIVPPGHYVKLLPNLVGNALASIELAVEIPLWGASP